MRLLQSVRARHSLPPMAQGISPKELPSFYPILFNPFQFVSRCFTIAVSPCLLALIFCYTFKIVIVPSTTLPMTNNLSFQSVLGGALKSVDCQSFLLRYVVSFRRGQTRAHGSAVNVEMRWIDPRIADAYPSITITSSSHNCFTHHNHIIITMIIATTDFSRRR